MVDDWEEFDSYLRVAPRRAAALADYAADLRDEEYEARFGAAWSEIGRGPIPIEWRAHFIASFRQG